jgi:hypothetical protein
MRHLAALNTPNSEICFTTYNQVLRSEAIYLLATPSTTTSELAISIVYPLFRTSQARALARSTSLLTFGRLVSRSGSLVFMYTSTLPLATKTSYLHCPDSPAIIQALLLPELSRRSFLVMVSHLIGLGGLLLTKGTGEDLHEYNAPPGGWGSVDYSKGGAAAPAKWSMMMA